MSYKKIPEYVRENVEEMTEEEFSAAYAKMFLEREQRRRKEARLGKLFRKDRGNKKNG